MGRYYRCSDRLDMHGVLVHDKMLRRILCFPSIKRYVVYIWGMIGGISQWVS